MVHAPEVDISLAEAGAPMVPSLYQIRRFRKETEDTFTVELESRERANKVAFASGQFNMLYVFGVGEIPISISGDPTNSKILVHTTRAVGTVTKAMYKLRRGDMLGVRGPYGTPWPLTEASGQDVVIVAGGIGLAPLRSALYYIIANREQYGKVVLLYGTRTPADILFREELEQWRARFDLEVHVTVDRAMSGWKGNVGIVTGLIAKAPFDPQNAIALICGPEVMMRFTAMELHKRGVDNDKIFVSMERNMKCGIGLCGHCQFGPLFVCKDGPVFNYSRVKDLLLKREI
ncbi:MAG: FAD/NAD(P)-binding protein [Ignavibacteriales bacterium]|nr:FAD/NAD(P)-binding protein [Ignavibacteriales bacterium]